MATKSDLYELTVMKDGKPETIKAVALIAFVEVDSKNVALRMFDKPEIPESWWRGVITSMYEGLDEAMKNRRLKL